MTRLIRCLIISGDLKISYINDAAKTLLSVDDNVLDKKLSDIQTLWKILDEPLRTHDDQRRFEISVRVKRSDIRKRSITVLSFRSKQEETPSRLIIIK